MADCVATFPGLPPGAVIRFSGTSGVDAQPGRYTLTVRRETNVATDGDLVFVDRVRGVTITVPRCRRVDARYNGRGDYDITLEDRRWRWRTGAIFGRYNTPIDDNSGVRHEKTPQELAAILWGAMNETSLDATLLPNGPRPAVDWYAANPADELIALCAQLGCVLAPALGGGWKVWPVGSGQVYDGGLDRQSTALAQTFADYPDQVAVVTGPIQYEAVFALEAVGEETDGRFRPLDDLSYTPAWGWDKEPDDCPGIDGTYTRDGRTLNLQDLARSGLRRLYRIAAMPAGSGSASLNPPGYADSLPDVTSLSQLLPLAPVVNEVQANTADPDYGKRKPAELWGEFARNDETSDGSITRPGTRVRESFGIDAQRGIVRLSKPLSRPTDTGADPARLYLRCVVEVEQPGINAPAYYVKFQSSGLANGTGAEVILKEELQLQFRPVWGADGTAATPVDDGPYPSNQADIDAECDYYLAAKVAGYTPQQSGTIQLRGLHAPALNGRVTNVTWAFGAGQAPTTTIGVGAQANPYLAKYTKDQSAKLSKSQALKRERQERLKARGLFRGQP